MTIERLKIGDRMSQAVIYNGVVYLAGQVAQSAPRGSYADQTGAILAQIDALLAEAGTDKSKALSAQIWIADMARFNEMNAVWDAWVAPGNPPARACVGSKLANPDYGVEIMLTAAVE